MCRTYRFRCNSSSVCALILLLSASTPPRGFVIRSDPITPASRRLPDSAVVFVGGQGNDDLAVQANSAKAFLGVSLSFMFEHFGGGRSAIVSPLQMFCVLSDAQPWRLRGRLRGLPGWRGGTAVLRLMYHLNQPRRHLCRRSSLRMNLCLVSAAAASSHTPTGA